MKHGASAYRNGSCRCDVCRTDATARSRAERVNRAVRLMEDPALATHGTKSTYRNWLCRCGPCAEANRRECAAYYRKTRAS